MSGNERMMSSPWMSDSMEKWTPLTEGQSPVQLGKNTTLYYQGDMPDAVYLIRTGRVRVLANQAGNERHLYIAERGTLIGEHSALFQQPHNTSAVAIVSSSVYRIPLQALRQSMQTDPSLNDAVLKLLCRKHNILLAQLLTQSYSRAVQRIAIVLQNLMDQYGSLTPEGTRINIRFTHQDISNITGISRVTVNNTFIMLVNQGVIIRTDGCYVVHNRALLANYAWGDESE